MQSTTSLRDVRVHLGLTMREVARRTGINSGRLSIIERGVEPTDDERERILTELASEEQLQAARPPEEISA